MIWGEVMLCLEIIALCKGIQPMDVEKFFRKPNEIYSKYFVNRLNQSPASTKKECKWAIEMTENKLHELIASMDRDQFMSNEPISAEGFFAYHRSKLRPVYYKILYITSKKK